jgi:hypothetical protein
MAHKLQVSKAPDQTLRTSSQAVTAASDLQHKAREGVAVCLEESEGDKDNLKVAAD